MMRRCLISLLFGSLLAIAFAPSAFAVDTIKTGKFEASVTTDTLAVGPSTKRINATITITAGKRAFAVGVDATSPRFSLINNGVPQAEGATLQFVRVVSTTGRFETLFWGEGFGEARQCAGGVDSRLSHGGSWSDTQGGRGVAIPAGKTISLTFAYDVSGENPWLDTSYAPGFHLSPMKRFTNNFEEEEDGPSRPDGSLSIKRAINLFAPSPVVARPLGAKVEMTTEPAPRPPVQATRNGLFYPSSTDVKPGVPVDFVGKLLPAEAGKLITVRVTGKSLHGKRLPSVLLGPVATDESGQFRVSGWTPIVGGGYSATATYPDQPGDLAADAMCPLGIYASSKN
jgi:hypothetical protein